jgi:predicted Zn-dependent protease
LYLEGKYWEKSCKNSYSDNVALMALSIEKMTGYIPYAITADHLPLDRQDIWGTFLQHEEDAEEEVAIAKIVQQKTVVEDVEVFTSAKVMGA